MKTSGILKNLGGFGVITKKTGDTFFAAL